MTRAHRLQSLGLAALVLLALPLRSDGSDESCFNSTLSYDSAISTVSGDESFFKLPIGPANVMFLFDNSGSMDNLVQCVDDNGWNDKSGGSKCVWPTTAELAAPAAATATGTCNVSGTLDWMNLKGKDPADPTKTIPLIKANAPLLVDPGKGTNSIGLDDTPTWGTGCTGDGCLFDPNGKYPYSSWTQTSAKRVADCRLRSGTGALLVDDKTGAALPAPDAADCQKCLDEKGFYFVRVPSYCADWNSSRNRCDRSESYGLVLAGWWLNANPPKFMTARKVIKETVWIDKDKPTNLDAARFGLAILNPPGGTSQRIAVPLGPSKADSFPLTPAKLPKMVEVRQTIINALNRDFGAGTAFNLNSGGTPVAPALANVGQYFNDGAYLDKLGISDSTHFTETTPGLMKVPWATNNCAFCWGCQTSAVLIVTDGSPNTETATPTAMRTYGEASYVTNCGPASSYAKCISPTLGKATWVPRVAAWLKDNDLRNDLSVGDPQSLTTIAIGYGIKDAFGDTSNLWNILQAASYMGGSKNGAYDATTPEELANAITKAVSDVVDRANSFSAPAASSLSTIHTAASEAFITRFKPNDTAAWEGHVFQGLLFDEYLNGCDPTKTPTAQPQVKCGPKMVYPNFNGNTDKDGFNICSDVFLVDKDCDEVEEDAKSGEFYKKGTAKTLAELIWDAGKVLSDKSQPGYRTAEVGKQNSRFIFTELPGVGGGQVELVPANAAKLAPFLNLDPTWCLSLLKQAKLCGGTSGVACPTVAGWTATNTTTCATAVINYVRGWDVLDADNDNCGHPGVNAGCAAKGVTTDGEQRDRANHHNTTTPTFWKLGDVFHSSPVLVKPPATSALCDTGYENQCVATLRSPGEWNAKATQTPIETYDSACRPGADAYEAYRYDKRNRQRLVLVGANDGMLHAFDAGAPVLSKDENSDCERPYDNGTGGEVWAYVPTDLLPKLKDTIYEHQYMVDGSTMVRDVWTDVSGDGKKQRDEYRTVAVLTERGGGSQWTALDVTDPAKPKHLWTFPPPGSAEQKWMAQAWSDFAPRPPPMGPVRLKVRAGDADPTGRGFTERWVVMINGGYDPAMSLGAAVWMVDAISGAVLWSYTNDDFKKQFGYGPGTSMFPVPGAVSLVDIGDTERPRFDNDGFFDTALWGDLGGSLFTARFHEPGVLDPITNRVTNWFVARTFEQQRRADDLQYAPGRSEFFYMPEMAYEPVRKAVHAYLGSGNRERMMQQDQGCGPDNVLACCKAGCSAVTAGTTSDFGACTVESAFTCSNGRIDNAPLTDGCGSTYSCAPSGSSYSATTKLEFTCPGASPTVTGKVSCDASGVCVTPNPTGDDDIDATYDGSCTKSRFFGVLAYGAYKEKMFSTAAEAAAFEKARYTDLPFTSDACPSTGKSCSLVDTTKATASVDSAKATCPSGVTTCSAANGDPGWYYQYGDVCPTRTCPDFGTCSAEKTGSGALVTFGCVLWNGFQPIGAQGGTDPCTGDVGTPLAYGYATDFVSGVPKAGCGYTYPPDATLYRGQQRASVSPPSAPLLRVTAGAGGGVHYGGLQLDPGAAPEAKSTGERSDIAEPIYWLEIDRKSHACRHDAASASSSCE